jgi:hypothetical protein
MRHGGRPESAEVTALDHRPHQASASRPRGHVEAMMNRDAQPLAETIVVFRTRSIGKSRRLKTNVRSRCVFVICDKVGACASVPNRRSEE